MVTDTSEHGLKRLICAALAGSPCDPLSACTIGAPVASLGGMGWSPGIP